MNSESEFFFFLTQDFGESYVDIKKRPTNLGSRPYYWCPCVPKETNQKKPMRPSFQKHCLLVPNERYYWETSEVLALLSSNEH